MSTEQILEQALNDLRDAIAIKKEIAAMVATPNMQIIKCKSCTKKSDFDLRTLNKNLLK